jgi:hypothetical protein
MSENLEKTMLTQNVEEQLAKQVREDHGKAIADCTNEELYLS